MLSCIQTRHLVAGALVSLVVSLPAAAQTTQVAAPAAEDSFASENAVLDTSILFAIGAREARQEIRGAFGWPTFQEGLVEGVYFRFDPDGYARFAPTPRLDTDVFEVICRPRTLICMGRKNSMQVNLNNRGQIELQLENVTDADTFAVAEGVNELPLPNTVLQPLEERLEILLSSGGELVIRRGQNEVDRISLTGFSAVIAYLRWVAARQDYTVLPRAWPVPNTGTAATPGLTQSSAWQSPMPQPQVVSPTNFALETAETGQLLGQEPLIKSEVDEVRGELKVLREILLDRQTEAPSNQMISPVILEDRVAQLEHLTRLLIAELEAMHATPNTADTIAATPAEPMIAATAAAPANPESADNHKLAIQLEYLMSEIGLPPDIALMLIQQRQAMEPADPAMQPGAATTESMVSSGADSGGVIEDILKELRDQLPPAPVEQVAQPKTAVDTAEYKLLSDYFRSVTQ